MTMQPCYDTRVGPAFVLCKDKQEVHIRFKTIEQQRAAFQWLLEHFPSEDFTAETQR